MSIFDSIMTNTAGYTISTLGSTIAAFTPSGGQVRYITVMVTYPDDSGQVIDQARKRTPLPHVTARNDATSGIETDNWTNNDAISIPPQQGGSARTFHLARLIYQDAGLGTWEVQ